MGRLQEWKHEENLVDTHTVALWLLRGGIKNGGGVEG